MILDNLYSASFRGVPFLVGDVSTTSGRKTVTHEYPNTDRRVVEDLGLLNSTFTITGIVRTIDDFEGRDRLIDALNQSGPGELVHPFFGTATVVPKPHTVSENTRDLGIAQFRMVFERVQDAIFPSQAVVRTSQIKALSDDTLDAVEEDLAETFSVSSRFASNYAAALEKLQEVRDTFNVIGQSVNAVTGTISSFTATVTSFADDIASNIFAPAQLASSLKNVFLNFDALATNIEDQFNLAKTLFGFGDDDPIIQPTTVARQEKADNNKVINDAIKTNALALAYNNAAGITYENERQLQEVREELEAEYQNLIQDTILSGDTLDVLQELRTTARQFFDETDVTVAKIRDISVNTIPMSVLAYQYYGDTDRTQALIDLNDTRDVSFVSGDIQILTL